MKQQKRTLRKREGEGWGAFLLRELRERADDPAIKRIDEILGLLVAADGYRREQLKYLHQSDPTRNSKVGIPEFLDLFGRLKESERAYDQTLDLLNEKLSRYRWQATVIGDINGFRSHLDPVGTTDGSSELMQSFMVGSLLKALDRPGEIARFRRCSDCQQWFYAIRGHQQFCGNICRRRNESQNPEFKEKRRTYMRERYRPLQKELEERSVTLAKGKKKKEGR